MVIFVDIDETICENQNRNPHVPKDYSLSYPIKKNIKKVNKLYEEGNKIVYWTARGAVTGIDWTELTTKQLQEWGCMYHELRLDKPFYDLFIDDKVVNSRDWEND